MNLENMKSVDESAGAETNDAGPGQVSRQSGWSRVVWMLLVLVVAWFVVDIAIKPAASTYLTRDVSKAELIEVARAEFQLQYDAINTGRATQPFATASDAADWAAQSKAVVLKFKDLSERIAAGERDPLQVQIANVGWVAAWNTPVLKMRIVTGDVAAGSGSLTGDDLDTQSKVIVGFHQVDGAWRVAWVDRQNRFDYLEELLSDKCFRAVDGKVDGSRCDFVPAG